jgi:3-oxoadipate enol-lactonase
MNLHVRDSGRPERGRGTIVFLHGFPFDGSMWDAQLAAMPPGWRGLAPDLRGFGGSPMEAGDLSSGKRLGGRIARDHEPVLTMASLADDVADLILRETDGDAVVCGLSMGGYVALELWRRHPTRVRALILADTRSGADTDEAREDRMRMAQIARRAGGRPIADAMLPALLAPDADARSPGLRDRVRTMIGATPAATLVAALAGMAARHDSTGELGAISVPTLVLTGELDAVTPPDGARAMADAIPGARFAALAHAAHLANMENAADFNAAIAEFLADLH